MDREKLREEIEKMFSTFQPQMGISRNGVKLCLWRIPSRKGLAICFQEGGTIYPVAYIARMHEEAALKYWEKLTGGSHG